MPKYILHGGMTRFDTPSNKDFFKLMADEIPLNGTWLGIYFAREPEDVQKIFERDIKQLNEAKGDRNDINLVCAEKENLLKQMKQADVIFISGGNTVQLFEAMNQHPDMKEHLKLNKTYAGSSAGAQILCREYVEMNESSGEGFGIIPFSIVVHHRSPIEEYKIIQSTKNIQKPILKIHETQFVVIEV
ncbi:MAG: Type 1 glutamine amidotransferase-like domain-containing protein [Alphaproteobacteria bacterium]